MKKFFALILLSLSIITYGQETPPVGIDFKTLPTFTFKYYSPDQSVWMYKGSTYGWTNLTKYANYRRLNDHDSLSTLQERSYSSLLDLPTFRYSLTYGSGNVNLVGDADAPGNNKMYGTNASGVKGWYNQSIASSIWSQSGNDIYYNIGKTGMGTTNPISISESSAAGTGYWNNSNGWATQSPPLSTFTITNTTAGGYDPVILFRQTSSGTPTIKNAAAIGLVGRSAWSEAVESSQISDMYFAVKNNSGGITERMRISYTGSVLVGTNSGSDRLVVARNEANSTGGVTLHNQNTIGYGGRVTFSGEYNGGYNFGAIEAENHSTGGRFSIYTSNTSGTLIERIRWDNAGNAAMYGQLDVGGVISATSGNSTQWNTAYTHSQIAGGNSVHVSTTENTQWDAAYTHSVDQTQAHDDYLINNGNDVTSGSLTATNFILSSDRRFKEKIRPIQSPLYKFRAIEFVQFKIKSEPKELRYGVIAQDVEKIAPELVRTDEDGLKSVAYIDLLIAKIADLEQRVLALEKEVNTYKRK
jgi:hypothetical protein